MAKDTIFLAMTPKLRTRLETTIEALINLLDEVEGDPDTEPNLSGWGGSTDDSEDESELLEDNADTEPNGDEQDYSDEPGFGCMPDPDARPVAANELRRLRKLRTGIRPRDEISTVHVARVR